MTRESVREMRRAAQAGSSLPRVRGNQEWACSDKSAVAALTVGAISGMSRDGLVDVIERAEMPFLSRRVREQLIYLDRGSLERLAHLARRCCRNQGY